jgi:hypothetical protein
MSGEMKLAVQVAEEKEQLRSPLKMLPEEWRKPVSFFWMCNAHLLPSSLSVCARLKFWISEGLLLEDAQKVFRLMLSPEKSASYQYAGQLMADLSANVDEIIKRKRAAERQAKFEREAEDAKRASAGVVSNLAESFRSRA